MESSRLHRCRGTYRLFFCFHLSLALWAALEACYLILGNSCISWSRFIFSDTLPHLVGPLLNLYLSESPSEDNTSWEFHSEQLFPDMTLHSYLYVCTLSSTLGDKLHMLSFVWYLKLGWAHYKYSLNGMTVVQYA